MAWHGVAWCGKACHERHAVNGNKLRTLYYPKLGSRRTCLAKFMINITYAFQLNHKSNLEKPGAECLALLLLFFFLICFPNAIRYLFSFETFMIYG